MLIAFNYEDEVQLLNEIIPESSEEISIDDIKEKVSVEFGVKIDDFNSRKRARSISYPRQIAMYISRELTNLSLPKIGEEFGGRDHTTVLHACDKISNDLKNDLVLKERLDKIILELK